MPATTELPGNFGHIHPLVFFAPETSFDLLIVVFGKEQGEFGVRDCINETYQSRQIFRTGAGPQAET